MVAKGRRQAGLRMVRNCPDGLPGRLSAMEPSAGGPEPIWRESRGVAIALPDSKGWIDS
jgi:hypothetical protein